MLLLTVNFQHFFQHERALYPFKALLTSTTRVLDAAQFPFYEINIRGPLQQFNPIKMAGKIRAVKKATAPPLTKPQIRP